MFKRVSNKLLNKTAGMREMFTQIHRDERGQGMAEYGLILALVAILVIGAITLLGGKLGNTFGKVTDALN